MGGWGGERPLTPSHRPDTQNPDHLGNVCPFFPTQPSTLQETTRGLTEKLRGRNQYNQIIPQIHPQLLRRASVANTHTHTRTLTRGGGAE